MMHRNDEAAARLQEAVALFTQTNRMDDAHAALLECEKAEPGNAEVLFWLAKSFFHNECDSPAAIRILRRALSIDSSRTDCKCLLVSALLDEDEPAHALIPLVLEAIAQEPDWVAPRAQLAKLYVMVGDADRADEEVKTVTRLMREHRASPRYKEYSYYEACVTGRHVSEGAERLFLWSLRVLRDPT